MMQAWMIPWLLIAIPCMGAVLTLPLVVLASPDENWGTPHRDGELARIHGTVVGAVRIASPACLSSACSH